MKLRNQSHGPVGGRLWRLGYLDQDESSVFEDFVESISVTSEELSMLVADPELSVPEVRRLCERKH